MNRNDTIKFVLLLLLVWGLVTNFSLVSAQVVNQPLLGLQGDFQNALLAGGLIMALCFFGAVLLVVVLLIVRRSSTKAKTHQSSRTSQPYQTPEGHMLHETPKKRFPAWVLWVGSAVLLICIAGSVIVVGFSLLTTSGTAELLGMVGMRAITTSTPTTTSAPMEIISPTETPLATEIPSMTATPTLTASPTPDLDATTAFESTLAHQEESQPTVVDTPPVEEEHDQDLTFDDWLKDVNILVHEDMWGSNEQLVVSLAINGLGLEDNTTHVRNAIGDLISYMESPTTWDLIILALESRSYTYSGDIFDALSDQLDRGASVIIEIWYLDQIASGRIQPLMQNCGIAFHQNWIREENEDWNRFVVYIWEPDAPVLSDPNVITFLGPSGMKWQTGDVGDLIRLTPGSNARLLAGQLPYQSNDFGLMAECFDGRMIWQTFSTHNYRHSQTLALWQNYLINSLKARYNYLEE